MEEITILIHLISWGPTHCKCLLPTSNCGHGINSGSFRLPPKSIDTISAREQLKQGLQLSQTQH